ncbi:MAG TPA: response regulator [Usitatibacteraceae bacterium]
MDHQAKILVVDDDRELRELLEGYLSRSGYAVRSAQDGKSMWAELGATPPDLVILDLMLPDEDGFVLCRQLRARSDVPIIMLTARGEETDRIVGLELGADDYLPKPFSPRELLARIRVVLRRLHKSAANGTGGSRPDNPRLIHFAGWTLDTGARHLLSADKVVVSLSGAEYRLLHTFLKHPNQVLNRDQLSDMTRGRFTEAFDRSLDVIVARVRRRLGDDGRDPKIIKTVRNEGYVLTVTPVHEP